MASVGDICSLTLVKFCGLGVRRGGKASQSILEKAESTSSSNGSLHDTFD